MLNLTDILLSHNCSFYRIYDSIHHIKLMEENCQFKLEENEMVFDSITDFIEYFEKKPIHRDQRLKYPINEVKLKILRYTVSWNLQCNIRNYSPLFL